MRAAALSIAAASLLSLFGCDKIKAAVGQGGGDAATSTSGGRLLAFLGEDFEGTITANIKGKAESAPQQITFAIKKPKLRVEIPGAPGAPPATAGGTSVIVDPPAKKGWVLVPAQRMAMEMDFDKLKSAKNMPVLSAAPTPPAAPPKIDKTGQKDTVAGYTCEVWKVTSSDDRRADLCVADGITWFDFTDLGIGSPALALAVVAADANRFPLRLVAYDASGAEETRMEATSVVKAKLDDAQFVVPPDYKTMDMAAMMSGLNGVTVGARWMPGHPGALPVPPAPPSGRPAPPKPKH
jgi:hypothetical protein